MTRPEQPPQLCRTCGFSHPGECQRWPAAQAALAPPSPYGLPSIEQPAGGMAELECGHQVSTRDDTRPTSHLWPCPECGKLRAITIVATPVPAGLPSIEQPAGDDPLGPPADVRARMAARGLTERPAGLVPAPGPQPGLDRAAIHEALGGGPGRHRTVHGDYNAARAAMIRTDAQQLVDQIDTAVAAAGGGATSQLPPGWLDRAAGILRAVATGE